VGEFILKLLKLKPDFRKEEHAQGERRLFEIGLAKAAGGVAWGGQQLGVKGVSQSAGRLGMSIL
jgi:hypothetical protein